jgi:hypothetical protein
MSRGREDPLAENHDPERDRDQHVGDVQDRHGDRQPSGVVGPLAEQQCVRAQDEHHPK